MNVFPCVSVVLFCLDSSQNDSFSDQEDQRPGFSMPSVIADDPDNDPTQNDASSDFTMYNSVSQKLMVMYSKPHLLTTTY